MSVAKLFLTVIAIIVIAVTGALVWSVWPISTDINKPDPAVVLANKLGTQNASYTEGYVGEKGERIHYVTAGEGEPIIFVHGFPSYWFTMFGLMEAFKSDYQVIAVDGLGVGRSEVPSSKSAYEMENLVGNLGLLIDELGLEKPHLVGHDWGSSLVTGYAQVNPDKVSTVTAMSALPYNIVMPRIDADEKHKEVYSYVDYFKSGNPILIKVMNAKKSIWEGTFQPFVEKGIISVEEGERYREDIGNAKRLNEFINWYRVNFPDFNSLADLDFYPGRGVRLTNSAIFIYGEEDRVVTPELVSDLKAASDNLKVISYSNIGHRPHFDKKEDVVREIRALIEAN